jgi:hypothetical protein
VRRSHGIAATIAGTTSTLATRRIVLAVPFRCPGSPHSSTEMIVQTLTLAWYSQARFGGRASRKGTGHSRYCAPNEAVAAISAQGVTIARSSGWARRHHHTAVTTAMPVITAPTVPIVNDTELYQCSR